MKKTTSERVLALLRKRNARYKFKELVELAKTTPRELHKAIAEIRETQKNLTFAKFDKTYYLSDTPTPYENQTDLSRILPLEGKIGVISDTHFGSDAERLDLVRAAYNSFEAEGIRVVLHCGDLCDGENVYRGHSQFIKMKGGSAQAKHFIENYPRKEGMTTYAISGNHDCESYLKTGMDSASLIVSGFMHEGKWIEGRKDIVYLGQYSHQIILPQEITIQMLHPRGNNSYARSYKQQKRSEAMDRNLRPDVQLSGHFHTFNYLWDNHTHFVALPGLQDVTEFFVRLGLPRMLGWTIVSYKISKGRLEYFQPKLFAIA